MGATNHPAAQYIIKMSNNSQTFSFLWIINIVSTAKCFLKQNKKYAAWFKYENRQKEAKQQTSETIILRTKDAGILSILHILHRMLNSAQTAVAAVVTNLHVTWCC